MLKICQHCGKAFEARRKDQKWCSKICASRNWGLKNQAHRLEYQRSWRKDNLEWVREYERKKLASDEKLRRYRKNYQLQHYFGVSLDWYEAQLEKQNYRCAICGKPQWEESRAFAVDHAHRSSEYVPEGYVRGLLCTVCNTRYVSHHVDPEIFNKVADYLKQHTGQKVPDRFLKGFNHRKKKKWE